VLVAFELGRDLVSDERVVLILNSNGAAVIAAASSNPSQPGAVMQSSRLSRWLIPAVLSLFAVAAVVVVKQRPASPSATAGPASSNQESAEEVRLERLEAELAALSAPRTVNSEAGDRMAARIEALRLEMLELRKALARRDDRAGQPDDSLANSDPVDSESAERLQTQRIVAFLNDALTRDKVDPSWSQAAAQEINGSLVKTSSDNTQLGDVRCQSSLCRIEASHRNAGAEQDFVMQLGHLAAFREGEAFYERVTHDDGSTATTIFVSRAGFRLPAPEQM
jgi:hypothetical protein